MCQKLMRTLVFVLCASTASELVAQSNNGNGGVHSATSEDKQSGLSPLYKIQPNDVLEIFVWKEPDLTRKVVVRPDGRISFPLIQDMLAADISPSELKKEIEEKLKEYVDAPNVTIIVDAIQSYRVFVTGKVQKPGTITVERPITVLQALALAGGFVDFADSSEITVISHQDDKNILTKFNYDEVIKNRNPDQNILLRTGDVVVVP